MTEPINLIGYIESKKGSVRANHFHPQQEQKCIFTQGKIIEVYKDLLSKNSKVLLIVARETVSVLGKLIRDKFEGKTQYQLFLHYVDANGKYKDRLFDGRRNIGLP